MKKKKYIPVYIVLILLILLVCFGFDHRLQTTNYTFHSSKLPAGFEGYKIAFLSDVHCKKFGSAQSTLLDAISATEPDIIVITGDLVDEDHTDLTPVQDLLAGATLIAPVYYVSGNHEFEEGAENQYAAMESMFTTYGVHDLDDDSVSLTKGDDSILLTGAKWRSRYVTQFLEPADTAKFNILLYHGSDFFEELAPFNYDLILAGHIHGGLIRLPFVGGLFTNTGELFPKYCSGSYTLANSTMISSRGLGDAFLPRFYNRPELICITLSK